MTHYKTAKLHPNPQQGKHFLNKIRKIIREGNEPIIKIIEANLSEDEALIKEQELIKQYGRADEKSGPLLNLTSGGDGQKNPSIDFRQKISKARKNKVSAIDVAGNFILVEKEIFDQSDTLVGINKGKKISNTEKQKGYIQAKDKNGNFYRIKKDDPRWISGELVGINKGKSPSIETRIKTSQTLKGKAKPRARKP